MNPFPFGYRLIEIASLADPWLPDWLRLYETTFPAEERILAGELVRLLQDPASRQTHHLLALVEAKPGLSGLALWQSRPDLSAATLWYLAVRPELRSGGLGSTFYQSIAASVLAHHRLLIFEVEMPAEAPDEANRRLRERRINFYRRNGARLLTGIQYLQTVGAHMPPAPMHLMAQGVEPASSREVEPLTPAEVFTAGQSLFGSLLTQTGELRLT
jgi:GNAT superfamily N-acetyltransferase